MNLDRVIAVRTGKTVYRDGDKVIKLFDSEYSKANILNEALNQARIEETGLNIPEILEVCMIDGKWAIVLKYIKGKTLEQLMHDNPDRLDEYLKLFIKLQVSVHSKKSILLTKLTDKMILKIANCGLDATTRYELHTKLNSQVKMDCVCHGDFNPSNIVISDDGTPFILDWSHVTQGNPDADVARTYLIFWLEGEISLAEKYLDTYCKITDTAKQSVQAWLPIVAASQLVKGKAEQREFLLHWINVVDYE